MIMEQGCTIRLWEDGMWLTRWRRSIIGRVHMDIVEIIRLIGLIRMDK